jgi:hypothetical protein
LALSKEERTFEKAIVLAVRLVQLDVGGLVREDAASSDGVETAEVVVGIDDDAGNGNDVVVTCRHMHCQIPIFWELGIIF